MESTLYSVAYMLSSLFELYIVSKFMNMFLGVEVKKKYAVASAYGIRFIVGTVQYTFVPNVFLNMTVSVATLVIITLCYGGSAAKKAMAVVFSYVSLFAAEAVVAGVLILGNINISVNEHNGDAFLYIGISVVLWIIYEIIATFNNINKKTEMPKFIDIIIVVLSIIIFIMETIIFSQKDVEDSVKIISVICMLTVLFLIIYMYDVVSRYYVDKIQSEAVEREKNYYMEQAKLLEQRNKEMKELRHDMKNHLYAINAAIEKDNEEAKKYIENIMDRVEMKKMYSSTGNLILDSMINYKLNKANEKNIKIYSKISIPFDISNCIEDMVTIVGNLLDNAIEACEKLSQNRYIDMKINYKAGALHINVKNGYDGIVKYNGNHIITKKTDKSLHGIGLKSVETAVGNHNGDVKYDHDEKEFRIKVILYI